MNARSSAVRADRITLSRRKSGARRSVPRRTSAWTLAGGLIVSTILLWVMVQLGQASSDPQVKGTVNAGPSPNRVVSAPAADAVEPTDNSGDDAGELASPGGVAQGPALDTPREIIDMLDLRKRDLDRREEAVRQEEERLVIMKADIEQLLARNEALEKRIQQARAKQDQQATDVKMQQAKAQLDRERQLQAEKNESQARLAKMYESMAPEDAAARLERMPDRKAIEILRLVKGKTAGSILGQVKADRAARLTEQLLAQTP